MGAEIEFGRTPESKQEYKPSSPDPKKAIEQKTQYNTAMDIVGKNLAKDMFENLTKGGPVNPEQFKYDMMSNSSFFKTVMQQWSTGDKKLADFIQTSGLSTELFEKNKVQLQDVLAHFKTNTSNYKLPQDAELYGATIMNDNGRLSLVGNIVSDSEGGKNYNVKYSISSQGNLTMDFTHPVVVEGVKGRI